VLGAAEPHVLARMRWRGTYMNVRACTHIHAHAAACVTAFALVFCLLLGRRARRNTAVNVMLRSLPLWESQETRSPSNHNLGRPNRSFVLGRGAREVCRVRVPRLRVRTAAARVHAPAHAHTYPRTRTDARARALTATHTRARAHARARAHMRTRRYSRLWRELDRECTGFIRYDQVGLAVLCACVRVRSCVACPVNVMSFVLFLQDCDFAHPVGDRWRRRSMRC
jgi:hypothetical protein